jgi:hypothetical protein
VCARSGHEKTSWHRTPQKCHIKFRLLFTIPKVRQAVEAWRRRSLNRAIGRLASLALKAAEGIARLGEGAESESVQLRAWRAILADQMAVSRFADLEHRMVEIEEQLRDRTGQTMGSGDEANSESAQAV